MGGPAGCLADSSLLKERVSYVNYGIKFSCPPIFQVVCGKVNNKKDDYSQSFSLTSGEVEQYLIVLQHCLTYAPVSREKSIP